MNVLAKVRIRHKSRHLALGCLNWLSDSLYLDSGQGIGIRVPGRVHGILARRVPVPRDAPANDGSSSRRDHANNCPCPSHNPSGHPPSPLPATHNAHFAINIPTSLPLAQTLLSFTLPLSASALDTRNAVYRRRRTAFAITPRTDALAQLWPHQHRRTPPTTRSQTRSTPRRPTKHDHAWRLPRFHRQPA